MKQLKQLIESNHAVDNIFVIAETNSGIPKSIILIILLLICPTYLLLQVCSPFSVVLCLILLVCVLYKREKKLELRSAEIPSIDETKIKESADGLAAILIKEGKNIIQKVKEDNQSEQKLKLNEDLYYPMKCEDGKVGRGIIIVNEKFDGQNNRVGADKDRMYFRQIYDKLGIDYANNDYYNQTASEMSRNLYNFTHHPSNLGKSVIFIAISSHGGNNGQIGGKRGTITLSEIFQFFYDDKALLSIPKVFLIQACRGTKTQGRVVMDDINISSSSASPHGLSAMPTLTNNFSTSTSDTLIVYATGDGFVAWRDEEHGSWFVKELRDCILSEKYNDMHLVDLLTICTNSVISNHVIKNSKHQLTETPSYQSTLKKFLRFPKTE